MPYDRQSIDNKRSVNCRCVFCLKFPNVSHWSIQVLNDYESGSRVAADFLYGQIKSDPRLLVCAATGNSPTRTYEALTERLLADVGSASLLRVIQLDEWGGLPRDDPASCELYLRARLIRPLDLRDEHFIGFHSDASNSEKECSRIDSWLASNGPIDVCVLGLGTNGHLGFNEPAESLNPRCHVAKLTDESLSHSMLDAAKSPPTFGMTIGMQAILASRMILLLVFGEAKAAQLNRLLLGGISTRFPASFLTLHRNVVCVCDDDALSHVRK